MKLEISVGHRSAFAENCVQHWCGVLKEYNLICEKDGSLSCSRLDGYPKMYVGRWGMKE